jgi:hypothetical protein
LKTPLEGILTIGAGGRIEGLRADESRGIALLNGPGGIFCGLGTGRFSGTGSVSQLGSTSSVSLSLISGGEPPPVSTLSPPSVAFGRVEPGELARRTVTITAGAAATINSIRVTAGNYYAITDPNRCIGTRLAERSRCQFIVVFVAPTEAATEAPDSVLVTSNWKR